MGGSLEKMPTTLVRRLISIGPLKRIAAVDLHPMGFRKGEHHLSLALAGVRQGIAQEVQATALPRGLQYLRCRDFQALVRAEITSFTPRIPRRVSERWNHGHPKRCGRPSALSGGSHRSTYTAGLLDRQLPNTCMHSSISTRSRDT